MSAINWETGVYETSTAGDKQTSARVTIASDWGALWDYETLMLGDSLAVYGDLLPLLRESDLNLVNVECALGEKGEPIRKGGPNLRAPASTVHALVDVPFHVGCLANNHIMDFGPESLEETIGVLREAGVHTVGAGMDGTTASEPLIVNVNGTELGIINCAEGEACASLQNGPGANPFDVPAIQQQIRDLKEQAGAVLVIFHGGREYAPSPPVYVVDALRSFAEAGATAVIAHHPHVPQGVEIHGGVPIAYSQGNFVFRWADTRGESRRFLNLGYLVHLDFAGDELIRFSLSPYEMKSDGVFALEGEARATLLQDLKRVSGILSTPEATQQAWDAFVDSMGPEGLQQLLHSLLNQFDDDAPLAAARLHNLFFSPAHCELYLNGLKRISTGEFGNSPQWAKEMVREWQT